jgi:hypothetical protein
MHSSSTQGKDYSVELDAVHLQQFLSLLTLLVKRCKLAQTCLKHSSGCGGAPIITKHNSGVSVCDSVAHLQPLLSLPRVHSAVLQPD